MAENFKLLLLIKRNSNNITPPYHFSKATLFSFLQLLNFNKDNTYKWWSVLIKRKLIHQISESMGPDVAAQGWREGKTTSLLTCQMLPQLQPRCLQDHLSDLVSHVGYGLHMYLGSSVQQQKMAKIIKCFIILLNICNSVTQVNDQAGRNYFFLSIVQVLKSTKMKEYEYTDGK